jgi:hypothetical protein
MRWVPINGGQAMIYELLPIESPKTAVISIARFGAMIRLPLTSNETPSGFSFSGTRLTELAESVNEKTILYTHDPRELCGWQVASGLQETVVQVIESLGGGENRVFVKSRNPNMVSTKEPPQARPPSQRTIPLKEIATYPCTDESENRLYEVIRYEPKSSRERHQKNGGLP